MANKEIDHSSRSHAYLSASGSDRWMNCTPSPELESNFEQTSSFYAREGTLAHEFAELNLKRDLKIIDEEEYAELVAPFLDDENYSEEMEDFVQVYVNYVIQQYTEAKRLTPGATLMIEEKVDYSEYVEGGYGTTDTLIGADKVLEVIDYKHGMGVKVSAEDNSQLKLYGLGALETVGMMFDIQTVRLTIVQPRLDSISSWEISVEDLLEWAENEVRPKAELAIAGEGDLNPGSWCKFCRAKARCTAIAEYSLNIAKEEFSNPHLLNDEELMENYELLPQVLEWVKSVQDYVTKEAIKGKKWEGFKLVEGRSNRKWVDEEKVIDTLRKKRFKKSQYMKDPKLEGITAIEKLVGKTEFPDILGHLVEKPKGNPTLVPASDNRKEYDFGDAKSDFAD